MRRLASRLSLGSRLSIAAAVAVAVAVALASTASYVAVRAKLRGQVDSALENRADVVESVRAALDAGQPLPGVGKLLPPGKFGGAGGYVQFITSAGTGDQEALPVSDSAREVAAGTRGPYLSDEHVQGTHVRVLTLPLTPGFGVQIARPLTETDHTLRSLRVLLALITAAGVLLALALGRVVSRTALAPVRRFTHSTEVAAHEPLGRRLDVEGDDEIGRLARSFNSTLEALESSVASQRQLVADASHELRTPLASLRTNVQVLARADELPQGERERLLRDLELELDELTALVGDVVELARGAQPDGIDQSLRLDELAAACVEKARRRAPHAVFETRLEPLVVRGDPHRLGRAIDNLLDNAVKWNPPDEPIEAVVADGVLSVRDHGAGIPEEDLSKVFDRFYRAAGARRLPGSGLGLAIVRQVAEAHGASVSAANERGGGARFTITFPAALVTRPSELAASVYPRAEIPAASVSTINSKLFSRSAGSPNPPDDSMLEKP
jgi:two-component system, OmpR family, sensor histidine kinase MprB